MNIYPLSFSRMQTFDQCPLRFDYQYITASHKDAGSAASRYGNRVHEAFEKYCIGEADLPDELEQFRGLLDKLKAAKGEQEYEMRMAVRRDKTPCGWEDKDCYIRGIVDAAVIGSIKGVAIDWKTGKPKDDTQQLKLMAAFMFEHYPALQEVVTQYFWVYYPGVPPNPITYTRDMLPDLWAHFEKKSDAMDETVGSGVFNPKPSGLCPWCPAYDTCQYARRKR